jgi:hypothetical protein
VNEIGKVMGINLEKMKKSKKGINTAEGAILGIDYKNLLQTVIFSRSAFGKFSN